MQTITWRRPAKRPSRTPIDHKAPGPNESAPTMTVRDVIAEARSNRGLASAYAGGAKPKTTWVWDRTTETWIEVEDKHSAASEPRGNRTTPSVPVQEAQPSPAPPSPTPTNGEHKSLLGLLSSRVPALSPNRKDRTRDLPQAAARESDEAAATATAIDASPASDDLARPLPDIAPTQAPDTTRKAAKKATATKKKSKTQTRVTREQVPEASPHKASDSEHPSRAIIEKMQEETFLDVAQRTATGRIETIVEQAEAKAEMLAQNIISTAEEQAKIHVEKIVATAEENARARAEEIIAKAEHHATASADRIISEIETKVEAEAESILAKTEEKAAIHARKIILQLGEKAEAQARYIINRTEEAAAAQVDRIVAQADEACQQVVAAAEHRAQHILRTAAEEARFINVPPQSTGGAPPTKPPSPDKRATSKDATGAGTVELVIEAPVDLGKIEKVLSRLKKMRQIRVLDMGGSAGRGVTVKLYSPSVSRLPVMLESFAEVESVSELPKRLFKICPGQRLCPGQRRGSETPVRRLLVTMAKRNT